MLNRSTHTIYDKLRYLNLSPILMKTCEHWTKKEDKFIIKYRDAPRKHLMKKLNRSNYSISYRKRFLSVTVDTIVVNGLKEN